jgi:hypothetical protein
MKNSEIFFAVILFSFRNLVGIKFHEILNHVLFSFEFLGNVCNNALLLHKKLGLLFEIALKLLKLHFEVVQLRSNLQKVQIK